MQTKADLAKSRSFLDLEPFAQFDRVVDPSVFAPVPNDRMLGLTDVVGSTKAIAAGRYKAINMAGVAAISAVMNALEGELFPFVFGGDGASFVVAEHHGARVREALAATAQWTLEQLGLELRTALVPVGDIRAAGFDVRLARFAASANVSYAMFSGGGVDWAERQMKAGRFLTPPAPPGTQPNLEGLSCRWSPIESQNGTIMNLIVREAPGAADGAFAAVVREIVNLLERREEGAGHPVSENRLHFRWPPTGLDLEARAGLPDRSLRRRRLGLWVYTLLAYVGFRTGWHIGGFDPARYRRNVALNSDFRKYDDGLRMTVDCHEHTADEIEQLLADAEQAGTVRYGTHRQSAALMTCIVPSIHTDDHLHFLDGAAGGYAAAARRIKAAEAGD